MGNLFFNRFLTQASFSVNRSAVNWELFKKGMNEMKKLFVFVLTEFSKENWRLCEVSVDFRRQPHPEDAITEYEQKFMDLGQPIYRAVWQKKAI